MQAIDSSPTFNDRFSSVYSAATPSTGEGKSGVGLGNDPSAFDRGAPAVPFAPVNEILSPDHEDTFDIRFGNRPLPAGAAQPAPPQTPRPFGPFTNEPMPDWPFPPPIFDFPDRAGARESQRSRGSGIPLIDEYIRFLNLEYGLDGSADRFVG